MSKQCLSIEQMQHLKELGVDTSKATFYVNPCYPDKHIFSLRTYDSLIRYAFAKEAVFTLQDILDLLPSETGKDGKTSTLDIIKHPQKYIVCFWRGEPLFKCENSVLIDAAYEMLCWVIENGYLEKNKQ